MADKAVGTISAAWNGTPPAPAGSVVQLGGFSYKPLTGGTAREDGTMGIQITGSFTATLQFEGNIDGGTAASSWFPIAAFPAQGVVGVHLTSVTAAGQWVADCEGLTGFRVRCSAYTSGSPVVTLSSSVAGLSVASSGSVNGPFNYTNITTDTTTVIKSGAGILHTVILNTPVATEVITIFDNTAASGTKIATITVPASPLPVELTFDCAFLTGLTILTATAASDITVMWR